MASVIGGYLLRLTVLGAVLTTSGCTFLPSDGPSEDRINAEATKSDYSEPYRLIPITTKVVMALSSCETASSDSGLSTLASPAANDVKIESLYHVTGMAGLPIPPRQTVAAGDQLTVTIFETGGGLYGPLVPGGSNGQPVGTSSSTLPAQVVDPSGTISVPYAGQVQALGRTPFEIQQDIVSRLKGKAIDPQALVTITSRTGGNLVTVTGDVREPSMVPIPLSGLRVLDAIAAAGGASGEATDSAMSSGGSSTRADETRVTVIRGSEARTAMLGTVLGQISENIPLRPGDTIILQTRPWNFLAFGALGKPGSYAFGKPDLNLADAMAQAGGATDEKAFPTIYLYRLEPSTFVKRLGVQPVDAKAATTPTIYRLDLTRPEGFFLAQKFAIRNKDILYFSSASSVGVLKFFGVVNALTGPARTGLGTASTINTLSNSP
jgi:polysaccharide export outer membrane protein